MGLFGNREEKKRAKMRKKQNERWKKQLAESLSYVDCAATLNQCEEKFKVSIRMERARYQERLKEGLPTERQQERIRNAARGLRVVQEAKAELEDSRLDGDLAGTVNMTCLAMKQMQRISDNTASVSFAFNKRAQKLFRSREEYENELNEMELPKSIENDIDQRFVDDLIAGKSYEEALHDKLSGRPLPTGGVGLEDLSAAIDMLPDDGSSTSGMNDEDEAAANDILSGGIH